MQITEQPRTLSVATAAITRRDTAVGVEFRASDNCIALSTGTLAGELNVEIVESVTTNTGSEPQSGQIRAVASDSSVRDIIINADRVALELDRNGDGTFDYNVNTMRDDLL